MKKLFFTTVCATIIVSHASDDKSNNPRNRFQAKHGFVENISSDHKKLYVSWLGAACLGNLMFKQRNPLAATLGALAAGAYISDLNVSEAKAQVIEVKESIQLGFKVYKEELAKAKEELRQMEKALDAEKQRNGSHPENANPSTVATESTQKTDSE